MKFGAFLPHIGPLARGDVMTNIRLTAQTAEALGFDSVWAADHVVIPQQISSRYPYTATGAFPMDPTEPLLEPLSVLSFVAACTTKVRLGTAVLVLPHRNAVVTAKTVATIDVLSRGRVILSVSRLFQLRPQLHGNGQHDGTVRTRCEVDLRGYLKGEGELSLRGAVSDEAISFSGKDCFASLLRNKMLHPVPLL